MRSVCISSDRRRSSSTVEMHSPRQRRTSGSCAASTRHPRALPARRRWISCRQFYAPSDPERSSPSPTAAPDNSVRPQGRQSELTTECESTYVDRMTEATKVAGQASSRDPKVGLRAVAALRRLVEQLEALQVENARAEGWSWQEIASELHVSKQAVHRKHAGRRFIPGRRRA